MSYDTNLEDTRVVDYYKFFLATRKCLDNLISLSAEHQPWYMLPQW